MANGTVAVIGAGPYGLATASQLLDAGVATRVFGETMGFWRHHMPTGMLLRSEWDGSNIAGPDCAWSLDQYEAEHGLTLSDGCRFRISSPTVSGSNGERFPMSIRGGLQASNRMRMDFDSRSRTLKLLKSSEWW